VRAVHDHAPTGGRLRLALGLTIVVLVVEVLAGLASHSLALLSDAGHLVTDVLALGLAWFAVEQAARPADSRRTYGYHRVGILAALVTGVLLVAVVAGIAFEAVRRLRHPEPVQGELVVAAALVALAVNAFVALRLRHADHDLNVRAALLHVLGDLAAAAAVVVAGAVIVLTGWLPVDPLLSLAIAVLVAVGVVTVIRTTVHVLLEGTPAGLDLAAVRQAIESDAGVESVHDLHVWSLSAGAALLSCHVVVRDELMADAEHRMRDLELQLCRRFGIGHTTIQLERCHPCGDEGEHAPGEHNHPHPAGAG
jgi:cobalt-zinc-cadmium efflux system protein